MIPDYSTTRGPADAKPEDVLALLREVYLSMHPESRATASKTLDEIAQRYA